MHPTPTFFLTLYIQAGATLIGSKNLADYTPQVGPPLKGDANQKHRVFARDAENIGLAGPGRIDGQGRAFWTLSGRVVPPPEESWSEVATADWKPLDRASPLIEFAGCRNLRIEDVRIENASGWTLRPINCDKVVIRGISIKNPVIGVNTDGIDPTGCRNLFITDCLIDTGDDAICLKSENPYGREVRVSKNVTIQTRNAFLRGCTAPRGTSAFLEVQGDQSDRIALVASELTAAKTAVSAQSNVAPGVVSQAGNVTRS